MLLLFFSSAAGGAAGSVASVVSVKRSVVQPGVMSVGHRSLLMEWRPRLG